MERTKHKGYKSDNQDIWSPAAHMLVGKVEERQHTYIYTHAYINANTHMCVHTHTYIHIYIHIIDRYVIGKGDSICNDLKIENFKKRTSKMVLRFVALKEVDEED